MGKLSKLVDLIDGANESLDMSQAARMQRAKEQRYMKTYHGAPQEIPESGFRMGGFAESDMGQGIYSTTNKSDASYNYADYETSQDLMGKIDRRAEQIEDELGVDYDEAKRIATEEIVKAPNVMQTMVRSENPVRIGGDNETYFNVMGDYDIDATIDDAAEQIAEEYADEIAEGVYDSDEIKELANDRARDLAAEMDYVEEPKIFDSLRNVQHRFDDADVEQAIMDIRESGEEEVSASDLIDMLKGSEGIQYAMSGDSGDLASGELIRQAFQDAGYDSIIDATPNLKWGSESGRSDYMPNLEGTEHVIAFDPSQMRSVNAAFDPNKTDSSNLLASKGAGIATGLGATGLALDSEEAEASFIGKAAKTFSKEALDLAEEMTKQGKSRDEIWQATGQMGAPTFKDVDGHWKQEISDDMWDGQTDLNLDAVNFLQDTGFASQSNILTHPELYKAYPDLANIPISKKSQYGGTFRPNDLGGDIGLSVGDMSKGADISDLHSVNQHELQHAIQEREGFAKGGSPEMFDVNEDLYREAMADWGNIRTLKKFQDGIRRGQGATDDEALKLAADRFELIKGRSPSELEIDSVKRNSIEDIDKNMENLMSRGVNQYQRLAGEAESRNVQTRLDMTMDERVNKAPWETLDVPEDELIVRGSNSGTPSLASVKQADESEAVYDNFITKRASKPPTARVRHRQAQRQAMLAKQAEEAKAAELAAQINESLQAMDFNRQSIEAPEIPAFHTAADWVGKYNRALKGSPAEYLISAEGLEDYLRKAAYGEAGMLDRAFAVGEAAEVGGAPIAGAKYLKGLTN